MGMRELFQAMFFFTVFASLVLGAISYSFNIANKYSCLSHGEITGEETQYKGFNCYQKQDGKWVIIN